jgi:hypothetical protein
MARYSDCILFAVDLKAFHEKKAPSGQIVTSVFMDGIFLTSLCSTSTKQELFPFYFSCAFSVLSLMVNYIT